MDFSTRITIGGKQVILADQERDEDTAAWCKANSIFLPLGPAHSEAWLLLSREDVLEVKTGTQTLIWTMTGEKGRVISSSSFKGWKLLIAEKLLQGAPDNDKALYLCQFVDARYFAAKNSDSGSIRANIRSYAQSSDYLDGTSGVTWTSLVTGLWNSCGNLGAFPGLPAGLPVDSVPETTFFIGTNGYRALCSVLDQLDCAIAPVPATGTYTIVQLGGAQNLAAHASRLETDFQPISNNNECAATLNIYFKAHYRGYGQENDTALVSNWAYNGAGTVLTRATGIAGASGTKSVWDDMPYVIGEAGTNTNAATLSTRADNRKTRYVTRSTVDVQHKIYSGILADLLPGGQVRAVLFRNWGILNQDFGGTVTEIQAGTDLVTGFKAGSHNLVTFIQDKSIITAENENYAPVDLGRKTYPNYPRLPNIVQVYSSPGSQGKVVQPTADNLHPGRVKRWVAGELETFEDCWIRFCDNHDVDLGYVYSFDGETYGPARLSGIKTSEGRTLPIYTVTINAQSFFGITRTDWDQGTKVDVDIYAYVLAEDKWKKCFTTANCVDWYMNKDDTIPKNTKVEIVRYGQVFVVANMYCSATDLPEFKPSPVTGTPGEMEGATGSIPGFYNPGPSPGESTIIDFPDTIDSLIGF